ncbi:MAG: NAD-dependent epimerase/dehydratase family protein [Stellaceae bacterium]
MSSDCRARQDAGAAQSLHLPGNTLSRILVTGGAGFIGSRAVGMLVEDGRQVTVIDDLSTGSRKSVSRRADLIVGSITDADLVNSAVAQSDACIHLAAIASVQRCETAWAKSHQVNQSAFVGLLEAVARRPAGPIPVVYASSAAVYGEASELPTRENSPTRPLSLYGADKLGCELQAHAAARAGVPSFGLRLYNVYGRGQSRLSSYSGVISIFLEQALKGEPLTIYGDGTQARDFIHVDDAVRYILAALTRTSTKSPICNVGTGVETTILDLARTVCRTLKSSSRIRFAGRRRGDLSRSVADTSLANKIFKSAPQIPLAQGLQSLLTLA